MPTISDPSAERARQHVETLTRSLFQIHGYAMPADPVVGQIVAVAVGGIMAAGAGLGTLNSPESVGNAAIGLIDQLVRSSQEANKPVNAFSADAARKQAASGESPTTKPLWSGDSIEAMRIAAFRSRDAGANGSGNLQERDSASGARFDNISSTDWGSPAGLAKMRDYAIQSGVPWAANNPELLRLGPAAVGALAAVQFKQETYKTLTTDASFKAKDVVALARFAKDQHLDANNLGNNFAVAEKPMSQEERAKFNGAVVPYMADMNDPAKRDRAIKAFDEAEKAHPEAREHLRKLRDQVKLQTEKLENTAKNTNAKEAKADTKDIKADTKIQKADTKIQTAELKSAKAEAGLDAFNEPDTKPDKAAKPGSDEKPPGKQPVRVAAAPSAPAKAAAPKPA